MRSFTRVSRPMVGSPRNTVGGSCRRQTAISARVLCQRLSCRTEASKRKHLHRKTARRGMA
jgi:hypothetical protein